MQYFWGHQDDSHSVKLDHWAKLNVKIDHLVKVHLQTIQPETIKNTNKEYMGKDGIYGLEKER